MTPEQKKQLREKYGLNNLSISTTTQNDRAERMMNMWGETSSEMPEMEEKPSFLQEQLTKAGEEGSKLFETGTPIGERITTAGQMPLRAVGIGARSLSEVLGKVLGKGIEKTSDIIAEIPKVKEIAESNFGSNILAGAEDLSAKAKQALEAIKDKVSPEVYQSLADSTEIALWTLGEKPAQQALKTTAEVGSKVAKEALEAGVKGLEQGLKTTGRATKGIGKTVYQSAITPTTKEAERLLSYKADVPFIKRVENTLQGESKAPITRAQTAMEKGIAGTESMVGIQAKRENKRLWKEKVEPAIKQSKKILTKDDLFAPIEERISKTVEPGKRQDYLDAYEAIKQDYTDFPEIISLEDAQKLKSGLDKFTPEKIFRGKSVANEYQTLKNDMANAIREITYETLDDVNIKKDYLDWANLKELEDIGVKAISEAGTKGGFGGFWTTMWNMTTTPIKTIGGQVLYRVGNKLEFIGEKGIKNFGEYLKKHGFVKP